MTIRVAITGFGRIGRNVLRAHYEGGKKHDVEIVAINAPGDLAIHAHLLKHDSCHGRFNADVQVEGTDTLIVNGDRIRVFATRDPKEIPWGELNVDVVMECTGAFNSKEKSMVHIEQGAKKVLLSAPGKTADATVVYGVNQEVLKASDLVVSNASCTTNCLAPLAKALHRTVGIERGLMTTVHSYTNDQVLTDVYHKDMRRARAATLSMIPTKTGAAKAVGQVIPELKGRMTGMSFRVPTNDVSVVDLTARLKQPASYHDVCVAMENAAQNSMKGIITCTNDQVVSSDLTGFSETCIFDETAGIMLDNNFVKLIAWYDNEWGYTNKILDLMAYMHTADQSR